MAKQVQLLQQAAQLISGGVGSNPTAVLPPSSWRQAANIHYVLGRIFYQQARWELAIFHLSKALAVDSTFAGEDGAGGAHPSKLLAQAHNAQALQLMAQGKIDAASSSALAAINRDSTFLPAYTTAGLAYFQQGNYDLAVKAYTHAMRAQPSAQIYNNLGAAHEAKGELAAALNAYRRAVELDFHLAHAQKNLQRAQEKLAREKPETTEKPTTSPAPSKRSSAAAARSTAKQRDSLTVVQRQPAKTSSKENLVASTRIAAKRDTTKAGTPSRPTPLIKSAFDSATTPATISLTQQSPRVSIPSVSPSPRASVSSARPSPDESFPSTLSSPRESMPSARSSPRTSIPSVFVILSAGLLGIGAWVFMHRHRLIQRWSIYKPIFVTAAAQVTHQARLLPAKIWRHSLANRRRLIQKWSIYKPVLMASAAQVTHQVRLLPAKILRHSLANGEHKIGMKLLPSGTTTPTKQVEPEVMPSLEVSYDADESSQPSLQTQTFFAEMIAAEPEIDEFGEEAVEKPVPEVNPTNGHVDLSSAAPSLPPLSNNEIVNLEIPVNSSTPLVVPTAETNRKNGAASLPLGNSIPCRPTTSTPVLETNAMGHEFNLIDTSSQQPATSIQAKPNGNLVFLGETLEARQGPRLIGAISRSAAEIPLFGDNQPKHGGGPAFSGPQVEAPRRSQPWPAQGRLGGASIIKPHAESLPMLGRYMIEREIGKGAMGNIYLARDPKLDRRVVIKTVCFSLASSEVDIASLRDRIYREARAIAKLSHPNIVVIYDVEDDAEMSYIVMEYIEGRDLRQVLKTEHLLDYERTRKIVAQVCGALDYAHRAGIIHRDVKPSNIMLLPNDKVKVTDFGIAKIADNFSLTLPGHVLGTPSYMAPEQFEGEEIDGRADIFSLGVVLYELVTGCRPFHGKTMASLAYKIVHKMHVPPSLQNVELPMALDEIIGRALAKEPEERYQTAEAFREALVGVEVEVVD
jgi:tRNA A-37 threonylcarbamoyl transferase component Bud32/Flp pilus assembly protein TadD